MVTIMKTTPLYDEILQLPKYEILKEELAHPHEPSVGNPPNDQQETYTREIENEQSTQDNAQPFEPHARHSINANPQQSPVQQETAIIRPKENCRSINEEHESFHTESNSPGPETNTGILTQYPPIQPLSAEPSYLPDSSAGESQQSWGHENSIMDDLETLSKGNALQQNRNKSANNRRRKRRR